MMTRKGSLMPSTFLGSAGQDTKVVDTLVPQISSAEDWMSGSVMRLMWPLRTAGGGCGGERGRRQGKCFGACKNKRTLLVPNLQGLGANAVEDREEARLVGVAKHGG